MAMREVLRRRVFRTQREWSLLRYARKDIAYILMRATLATWSKVSCIYRADLIGQLTLHLETLEDYKNAFDDEEDAFQQWFGDCEGSFSDSDATEKDQSLSDPVCEVVEGFFQKAIADENALRDQKDDVRSAVNRSASQARPIVKTEIKSEVKKEDDVDVKPEAQKEQDYAGWKKRKRSESLCSPSSTTILPNRQEKISRSSPLREKSGDSSRVGRKAPTMALGTEVRSKAQKEESNGSCTPNSLSLLYSTCRSSLEELYQEATDLSIKNERLQRQLDSRQQENTMLRKKLQQLLAEKAQRAKKNGFFA